MRLNPRLVIEELDYFTVIDGMEVLVKCQYKRCKYLKIKRLSNNSLLLITPYKLDCKKVEGIIIKYLDKIRRILSKPSIIVPGDSFLLFGKMYKKQDYTKAEIDALYKNAMKEIKAMFLQIKEKYHFKDASLYIRKMRSRWGVCYPNDMKIGLSAYLVFVPKDLIEYVILHEFCHFKYANHSQAFYSELAKYSPNHRLLKRNLKYYSSIL